MDRKGKFQSVLIGSCWYGEDGCGLSRSPHPMVLVRRTYLVSSGLVGPIAAEVVTWLPGLVVTEIMGQSLIFIYCLAIAHLYTQSLRANDV